jgi:hypothetical protein
MVKIHGNSFSGTGDDTNYIESGDFVSAAVGSDNVLDAGTTKVMALYCDDGGNAITTGTSVRAMEARVLVAGANASRDVSISGFEGHLKICSNVGSIGHKSGLWGYCEGHGADTTFSTTCCGVYGMIDAPTGSVIATSAYTSAFLAGSNTLAGTHTGSASALHIQTPVAGQWDAAFSVDSSASGCIDSTATYAIQAAKYLKCIIDGTSYRIPCYAKL